MRKNMKTTIRYERLKKSLLAFNLLFALCSLLFGCSPVGFLGPDTVYDTIWAEPKRLFYNLGESFVPSIELSVYASYRNFMEEIPLSRVTLSIVVRPGISNDAYDIEGDDFPLTTLIGKGRKQINVFLNDHHHVTSYNIMIDDPHGLIRDNEEEDPDDTGIGIIWKEPE